MEYWAFVDCCAFADFQGPVDCRTFVGNWVFEGIQAFVSC